MSKIKILKKKIPWILFWVWNFIPTGNSGGKLHTLHREVTVPALKWPMMMYIWIPFYLF